jgi:hypothetical protein
MNGPGSIAAWLVGRRQAKGREEVATDPDADSPPADGAPDDAPETGDPLDQR